MKTILVFHVTVPHAESVSPTQSVLSCYTIETNTFRAELKYLLKKNTKAFILLPCTFNSYMEFNNLHGK